MSEELPAGFTLDQPAQGALPPGFTLDTHPASGDIPGIKRGSMLGDVARLLPSSSAPVASGGMEAMPSLAPNLPSETPGTPTSSDLPAPLTRIGSAIGDSWNNTPNILMTPEFRRQIEETGPINKYITSPLLQIGGGALAGGNALFRGVQQGLVEAGGGPAGPGRDIAAFLEAAPMLPREIPVVPGAPRANPLADVAERATDRIAAPLPDEFRDQPFAPRGAAMAAPEVSARPGAVGADITTAPIPPKTPAERITDLEKSVQQTAEERAGPQLHDTKPYVPGIPPRLLASSEFKPVNSLDEKVAIASDPVFRAEVEANARERNAGMVDLLRGDAQDGNALDHAHEVRSEVAPGPLGVFDNEKPVDASGIVESISRYLRGSEGKQAAVRNTLKSVLDSLHDADGNLETLPSILYGARKNLTDLLKKGVKGTSDMADDVRASKPILMSLLPQFDETISAGAPKFSSVYLPKFHELSQPINQMEFLQKYQTGSKKITDGDGYLIPSKVQKMLDDILQGVKAPGVNAAKALTEAQIQNIINVRNELAAGKLRDRMAAVKGSDSFQQINRAITPTDTPGRAAVKGGAVWGAHGAMLMSPAAGWGNALLGGYQAIVKPAVKAANERKAAAAISARKNQLLTPPNALGPEE